MCFSKGSAAHSVETDLTSAETAFLDNLSLTEANTAWMAHIKLQGKQTAFKLETGAEVTPISSETYKALGSQHLNTRQSSSWAIQTTLKCAGPLYGTPSSR